MIGVRTVAQSFAAAKSKHRNQDRSIDPLPVPLLPFRCRCFAAAIAADVAVSLPAKQQHRSLLPLLLLILNYDESINTSV